MSARGALVGVAGHAARRVLGLGGGCSPRDAALVLDVVSGLPALAAALLLAGAVLLGVAFRGVR